MKLENIEHVFFDLDHTLWDFERNSALTFEHILKKNKVAISPDKFIEVYSPINFEYWSRYRNNLISKEVLRYGRLKDAFDVLGISVQEHLIHSLSEDYITYLSNYNHLFDGTLELLQYLKPKYKLHIITNGFEEVQHKKLKNSGIIKFFETIVTSEMAGVKKPHPKIFEYALKKANTSAEKSVMIGDNLEADINGANAIGFKTVYYDLFNNEIPNKQLKTNNLLEIITFL